MLSFSSRLKLTPEERNQLRIEELEANSNCGWFEIQDTQLLLSTCRWKVHTAAGGQCFLVRNNPIQITGEFE